MQGEEGVGANIIILAMAKAAQACYCWLSQKVNEHMFMLRDQDTDSVLNPKVRRPTCFHCWGTSTDFNK